MSVNGDPNEKRQSPRIARNFIVKHRLHHDGNSIDWDACFIKNISLKGCYYSSSRPYNVGELLDLQIRLPTLPEPVLLFGKVKRCSCEVGKPVNLYGIAVEFTNLDEEQKKCLAETVSFFLPKQK